MIRSSRWKLLKYWDGRRELFNIMADPLEQSNLIYREPELTMQLEAKKNGGHHFPLTTLSPHFCRISIRKHGKKLKNPDTGNGVSLCLHSEIT